MLALISVRAFFYWVFMSIFVGFGCGFVFASFRRFCCLVGSSAGVSGVW